MLEVNSRTIRLPSNVLFCVMSSISEFMIPDILFDKSMIVLPVSAQRHDNIFRGLISFEFDGTCI